MRSSACVLLIALVLALLPGCGAGPSDCSQPDVFCVGLVTSLDGLDDRAYNQAAWQGIGQAKDQGLADWTASIETVSERDYEENLLVFAEAGYDAIVSVGEALGTATYKAAAQYPALYFIGVDQPVSEAQEVLPNLTGLVFPEGQLGFLAGALAAQMTESGQVGAVLGSEVSSRMREVGEGFQAGAAFIDPAVTALVVYHSEVDLAASFRDPEWGAVTSGSLVDSGADVIFGASGQTGTNALLESAMRGVYGIGADVDQYYTLPVAAPRLLTSVVKAIPAGVNELLALAYGAQSRTAIFPAGNYLGRVGLAPYHDLERVVPALVQERMRLLVEDLAAHGIPTASPDAP